MDRSTEAKNLFLGGYNCAQSIVYVFRKEVGLPEDTALKIACGLGAGMARKGEMCGTVSGGILVLGMRYGRGPNDDRSVMETMYSMTQAFMRAFESKHGSCSCRRLLNGCDLMTADGQQSFKENDCLNQICLKCVESVVEILERM